MFTVLCRHVHSDWQSTEAFLYVKGKSNIIVLDNLHIIEIPTNKGANSYKHKNS